MFYYKCPFCSYMDSLNEPMEDGEEFDIECNLCGQPVTLTATVSVTLTARCADGHHEFVSIEGNSDHRVCKRCLEVLICEKCQ